MAVKVFVLVLCCFLICIFGEKILEHSVKCDPKQMHVFFEFSDAFDGLIYAKNHFNTEDCRSYGNHSRKVSISLPINVDVVRKPYCGVKLNKTKHEFDVTLFVNDAKDILVQGLRTFSVVCKYHLQDVTVQLHSLGGIHIGSANEEFQQDEPTVIRGDGSGVLPILDMAIREGRGIQGDRLQSATIGQEMTLDVFLDDVVPYDIFVYNCLAHDGTRWPSGTVTLIDRNGCGMSVERVTRPPVETALDENGIKHVFLNLRGFQFSTSEVVYFECQIKPCLHKCNITQCQVIRPGSGPLDSTTTPQPSTDTEKLPKLTETNSLDSFNLQTKIAMKFQEPTLEKWVGQGGEQFPSSLLRRTDDFSDETQRKEDDSMCLAKVSMSVIIGIVLLSCILCVIAAGIIWYKLRRSLSDAKTDSDHSEA